MGAGIGNMLGSFLNFGNQIAGMKQQGEMNRMARKVHYRTAQNQIQWRVADARAAGIHPLAAMGLPAMSTPSFHASMPSNVNFPRFNKPDKKQDELLQAQIDESKARAGYFDRMGQVQGGLQGQDAQGVTVGQVNPNVEVNPAQVTASNAAGLQSGLDAFFRISPDKDGGLRVVPTQKSVELTQEGAEGVKYMIEEAYNYDKNYAASFMPGLGASIQRDKLRDLRSNILATTGMMPGKHLRYNRDNTKWYWVDNSRGMRLYTSGHGQYSKENRTAVKPGVWKKAVREASRWFVP